MERCRALGEGYNSRRFNDAPSVRRIHPVAARHVLRLGPRHCICHHIKRVDRKFRPALHGNARRLPGLLGTKLRQCSVGMPAVASRRGFGPVVDLPLPFIVRWREESWHFRSLLAQPPSLCLHSFLGLPCNLSLGCQSSLDAGDEGVRIGNHQGSLFSCQAPSIEARDGCAARGRLLMTGQLPIAPRTDDADSAGHVPDRVNRLGNGSAAAWCLANELARLVDASQEQELRNMHVVHHEMPVHARGLAGILPT